jgi:hypothetical protein
VGYFANNTELDYYQAKYCSRCSNAEDDGWCNILDVHFLYAYKECNSGSNAEHILSILIPRDKNDGSNKQCMMFRSKE